MRWVDSLRFKLLVLYLFTILVPVLLISYAMPYYYHSLISNNTTVLTEGTLTALSRNVESYLGDLERLTIAPYQSDEVMRALKNRANKQYETTDEYSKLEMEKALRKTLPIFWRNMRNDILGTILLPYDGSVYVDAMSEFILPVENFPFQSQKWYQKAIEADGRVVFISAHPQDYLQNGMETQVFSVARLVKDPDSRQPLAVIMADADTVVLEKIVKDIQFNVKSIIAIFDDEHKLLYSSAPISTNMLQQLGDKSQIVKNEADSFVVVEKSVDPANWSLVVLLSNGEIKQQLRWMYLVGIMFAAVGLILTLALFFKLSRWIVKPFKEMILFMKKVQKGDFKSRLSENGTGEIAQLGAALNTMTFQLFELIDREYRAVLKQRDAEYRALQSQIQPHFLYNTLNGFIGLNRLGERKGLEKAILSLSSMLRYILEQKDLSTLKEEFSFLEKYCELQQIRFQEKLSFTVVCEETITGFSIPKLLLQPLVENAIIHGVEPLNRPCLITIIARLDSSESPSKISIEIVDDGLGFDIDGEKANVRIGIANVRERIRLFFPHAALHIESKPGAGTKITIEIPC